MKNTKKVVCTILAAALSCTFFAGCGGTKTSGDKTKLLIGLPGGDALTPWKIVETFKAENSDKYEIAEDTSAWNDFVQKLKLQFVAKNNVMPVFFTDSLQATSFGAQGAVLDLSDWADEALDKSEYNAALTSITDTEGHLWGVPQGLNSIGMLLNLEIFEERGIPVPDDNWTWEEMLDLAEKLTFTREDGSKVYGIYYSTNITQGWLPFMAAYGVQPYKDDFRNSNVDDPMIKKAMETYAEPILAGHTMPAAELSALGGAAQGFAGGHIAMMLAQSSQLNSINNFAPDLNWDARMMPVGFNGERTCIYVPNVWQIYSGVSEEEKEAALAWLTHFFSEESQMIVATEGSTFPCHTKAIEAVKNAGRKPANIGAFLDGIDAYGMTLLENPSSGSTRPIIDNMTAKIYAGENIDEWISKTHEDFQNELDYFYDSQE